MRLPKVLQNASNQPEDSTRESVGSWEGKMGHATGNGNKKFEFDGGGSPRGPMHFTTPENATVAYVYYTVILCSHFIFPAELWN